MAKGKVGDVLESVIQNMTDLYKDEGLGDFQSIIEAIAPALEKLGDAYLEKHKDALEELITSSLIAKRSSEVGKSYTISPDTLKNIAKDIGTQHQIPSMLESRGIEPLKEVDVINAKNARQTELLKKDPAKLAGQLLAKATTQERLNILYSATMQARGNGTNPNKEYGKLVESLGKVMVDIHEFKSDDLKLVVAAGNDEFDRLHDEKRLKIQKYKQVNVLSGEETKRNRQIEDLKAGNFDKLAKEILAKAKTQQERRDILYSAVIGAEDRTLTVDVQSKRLSLMNALRTQMMKQKYGGFNEASLRLVVAAGKRDFPELYNQKKAREEAEARQLESGSIFDPDALAAGLREASKPPLPSSPVPKLGPDRTPLVQAEQPYKRVDLMGTNRNEKQEREELATSNPTQFAEQILSGKNKSEQANILYSAVIDAQLGRIPLSVVGTIMHTMGESGFSLQETKAIGDAGTKEGKKLQNEMDARDIITDATSKMKKKPTEEQLEQIRAKLVPEIVKLGGDYIKANKALLSADIAYSLEKGRSFTGNYDTSPEGLDKVVAKIQETSLLQSALALEKPDLNSKLDLFTKAIGRREPVISTQGDYTIKDLEKIRSVNPKKFDAIFNEPTIAQQSELVVGAAIRLANIDPLTRDNLKTIKAKLVPEIAKLGSNYMKQNGESLSKDIASSLAKAKIAPDSDALDSTALTRELNKVAVNIQANRVITKAMGQNTNAKQDKQIRGKLVSAIAELGYDYVERNQDKLVKDMTSSLKSARSITGKYSDKNLDKVVTKIQKPFQQADRIVGDAIRLANLGPLTPEYIATIKAKLVPEIAELGTAYMKQNSKLLTEDIAFSFSKSVTKAISSQSEGTPKDQLEFASDAVAQKIRDTHLAKHKQANSVLDDAIKKLGGKQITPEQRAQIAHKLVSGIVKLGSSYIEDNRDNLVKDLASSLKSARSFTGNYSPAGLDKVVTNIQKEHDSKSLASSVDGVNAIIRKKGMKDADVIAALNSFAEATALSPMKISTFPDKDVIARMHRSDPKLFERAFKEAVVPAPKVSVQTQLQEEVDVRPAAIAKRQSDLTESRAKIIVENAIKQLQEKGAKFTDDQLTQIRERLGTEVAKLGYDYIHQAKNEKKLAEEIVSSFPSSRKYKTFNEVLDKVEDRITGVREKVATASIRASVQEEREKRKLETQKIKPLAEKVVASASVVEAEARGTPTKKARPIETPEVQEPEGRVEKFKRFTKGVKKRLTPKAPDMELGEFGKSGFPTRKAAAKAARNMSIDADKSDFHETGPLVDNEESKSSRVTTTTREQYETKSQEQRLRQQQQDRTTLSEYRSGVFPSPSRPNGVSATVEQTAAAAEKSETFMEKAVRVGKRALFGEKKPVAPKLASSQVDPTLASTMEAAHSPLEQTLDAPTPEALSHSAPLRTMKVERHSPVTNRGRSASVPNIGSDFVVTPVEDEPDMPPTQAGPAVPSKNVKGSRIAELAKRFEPSVPSKEEAASPVEVLGRSESVVGIRNLLAPHLVPRGPSASEQQAADAGRLAVTQKRGGKVKGSGVGGLGE